MADYTFKAYGYDLDDPPQRSLDGTLILSWVDMCARDRYPGPIEHGMSVPSWSTLLAWHQLPDGFQRAGLLRQRGGTPGARHLATCVVWITLRSGHGCDHSVRLRSLLHKSACNVATLR